MRMDVITLFPEMFDSLASGISGRAVKNNLLTLNFWNPRDFSAEPHRNVDDRPYGGGPGMVLKYAPLQNTLRQVKQVTAPETKVIYLSPQGKKLDQAALQMLASHPALIFIAGRYEGIDERFIDTYVDEEWSIGDYILSGGELAIMVVIDGIIRLLPNALGDAESAQQESFVTGLLDYPHYTRPDIIDSNAVPEVLLGGDHQAIERWRMQQALGRTWLRRPDLLKQYELTPQQQLLLDEFIMEYGVKSDD